jgi:hypothetical protein
VKLDIGNFIKDLSPAALLVLVVYALVRLIQDIIKNNASNVAADTKNEADLIGLMRLLLTMFGELRTSIDLLNGTLAAMNTALPDTIKANSASLAAGLGEQVTALNHQINTNTIELLNLRTTILAHPTTITDAVALKVAEILKSVHERIEQAQTEVKT